VFQHLLLFFEVGEGLLQGFLGLLLQTLRQAPHQFAPQQE